MFLTAPSTRKLSGKIIDKSYLLTKHIASGACGSVYHAVNTASVEQPPSFAVKVICRRQRSRRRLARVRREIELHRKVCSHPNIVTLHRIYEDADFIYVFLDFKSFDLFTIIAEKKLYWRNDGILKEAFCGLVDAVKFCHDQGVYHGGLYFCTRRIYRS